MRLSVLLPLVFKSGLAVADTPWFTGPLLAEPGAVIPPKLILTQPFCMASKEGSTVIINPILLGGVGITRRLEMRIQAPVFFKKSGEAQSLTMGDLTTEIGIQILESSRDSLVPDFTIGVLQVFPTGKYQCANPMKHGTDLSGEGSYKLGLNFRLQRLLHVFGAHSTQVYFNLTATFGNRVNIAGFNAYGGGYGTLGRYVPGVQTSMIASFEQSITQRWVISLDASCSIEGRGKFIGVSARGIPVNTSSNTVYSLAPALEYNLGQNSGFIGGVWQSLPIGDRYGIPFTRYITSFYVVF